MFVGVGSGVWRRVDGSGELLGDELKPSALSSITPVDSGYSSRFEFDHIAFAVHDATEAGALLTAMGGVHDARSTHTLHALLPQSNGTNGNGAHHNGSGNGGHGNGNGNGN